MRDWTRVFPRIFVGVFIMAAPRKNPPKDAAETIERLAEQGFTIIGIAKRLGVVRETFKKWCKQEAELQEAFENGRETQRQALIALIVQSAVANKGANSNAMFLLKTLHGLREFDSPYSKVDVSVAVANPVLIVHDFGSDAEWAAKAAAQQKALTKAEFIPPQLEAQIAPMPSFIPPAFLAPAFAPQAAPVLTVAVPAPNFVAPAWKSKA
jgi:transposase-like protein